MIIAASIAKIRHQIISRLRTTLDTCGFVELVTPVLHVAKTPTHAHPGSFYFAGQLCGLRNCMELRLRSALAELEAIYEIGPCFRQDLPDRDHSPEFQMLEIFWRKSDFGELCDLTRNLLSAAFGIPVRSFEYIDVGAALEEACPGLDLTFASHEILEAIKIRYPRDCSGFTRTYDALNWLIDKTVVCSDLGLLERPAMLVNYPLATVCLAKPQSSAPHLIERMEVFIDGLEICHGFVDDCDPDRVERRMNENGPQFFDPSFLELMRANRTPPSSGVGFGLERLLMLAGSINHIRDCLHEPQFHSREPLQ